MSTTARNARRAISRLGEHVCRAAFAAHQAGNGANSISWEVPGIKPGCTRQADAAIDAGRWLRARDLETVDTLHDAAMWLIVVEFEAPDALRPISWRD